MPPTHCDVADFDEDGRDHTNHSSVKFNCIVFLGGHTFGLASFMKFDHAKVPKIFKKTEIRDVMFALTCRGFCETYGRGSVDLDFLL